MEKKKIPGAATLILYCLCAVIWDINVIVDIIYRIPNQFTFYLHIICAILWNISSIILFYNFRKQQKEQTKSNDD